MPFPLQSPQSPPEDEPIVLDGFDGLKNTVSPKDLGPRDLAQAINVDLDDKGKARRRRGMTQVTSGNFHSLFNGEDGRVYGVKNGELGVIHPDYSFASLGVATGGDYASGAAALSYVQVGRDIYYSCATDNGVIDTSSLSWRAWGSSQDIFLSPVVNPTATLPAIAGKLIGRPPLATQLAYYNGRIYLAQGRTLWYTELFSYNFVNKTRTFYGFEGDITLVGSVGDGLYVGTTEGCWFLAGPSNPLRRTRVLDSPVVPGSLCYIPAELANPPQVGVQADTPIQVSIMFMTTRGMCVAKDGGEAYNLTEDKFFFPVAQRSAALYRRQDGVNQYVVVNDSEGQPMNGARFGDYVDAEIIRGNASWLTSEGCIRFSDVFEADWS
jgi:hypothetical protein